MNQTSYDPGLTQRYTGRVERMIREDGTFNVRRMNARWQDSGFYLYFMQIRWPAFLVILPALYVAVNVVFAVLYMLIGVEHLQGAPTGTVAERFLGAFFFSVQTFTTVGYGHIAPKGILTSGLAAMEALAGLLALALATGLLYGRFSRPAARIGFSASAVMAPFRDGQALMFRVANRRRNVLLDIDATVLLMTVVDDGGEKRRRYDRLDLDTPSVHFLPLTWTVVHPISETSPLWNRTPADLLAMQAEVMVLIRAFDDSFSQVVHSKRSYTAAEIVWNARFIPAFSVSPDGSMMLDLAGISAFERLV